MFRAEITVAAATITTVMASKTLILKCKAVNGKNNNNNYNDSSSNSSSIWHSNDYVNDNDNDNDKTNSIGEKIHCQQAFGKTK